LSTKLSKPIIIRYKPKAHLKILGKKITNKPAMIARAPEIANLIATINQLNTPIE
jgi:hypothetical protein